ncbi:MAG: UDP-3-O-[3-hydroxymyristoyl] N-acetylglucosamine deacetylase [Elusimicrobia bacterium]|nr:UDP-3-O-[3-hydroxymyristoyl] N-acetylglucosamine deacetylase [Elusimicrobiota bacterium]
MENFQTTLQREVSLRGIGLHTGCQSTITFRPAPPNTGIRFFRTDLPASLPIPARVRFVVATQRGTTLGLNGHRIHTVEHVLSACAGLSLDNADILLDGPEPPAMDGSALPFVRALLQGGLQTQKDGVKRFLRLPHPIRYESDASSFIAEPSEAPEIHVTYTHPHVLVQRQSFGTPLNPDAYLGEIAGARTFCFQEELEFFKKNGLAKGGSLDNAVVIGPDKIHTRENRLRYADEFVRHKFLDLLGDLALLGRELKIKLRAVRSGHTHNVAFAKLLEEAARKLRKNQTCS